MEILEKIGEFFKRIPKVYYLPLAVGCIGLMLFVYGIHTIANSNTHENTDFVDFSHQNSAKANTLVTQPPNTITVDIEGAVINPGVYNIAQESRLEDGLVAAGGLSQSADREYVAQHINLAVKLTDGTKIYIPRVGEPSFAKASEGQVGGTAVLGTQSQAVDINSASASDLDALPGVGPATANKIIAGRPYASIQDLLTRKIVSQKVFDKIKDLIVAQ